MSTTSLENNSFTLFFMNHRHYSIYARTVNHSNMYKEEGS